MNLLSKYLKKVSKNNKKTTLRESVDKIDKITTSLLTDDQKELFEERAAIMEYDGSMNREDAEREALRIIANMSVRGTA